MLNKTATSALAAAGLVGGYAVARQTGNRQLGGAVLAAAGGVCTYSWVKNAGAGKAAALIGTYVGAFGASHPLSKKVGAWQSVGLVAAGTALASQVLGGR
ncbi:hypothetical protein G4X40_01650 [Rhodococcus sp. D2-41]|uniref:Uncharacterized protein n=1 Tax=Speluncibacter jeojiensis TaxID=2710754 RepID=A0A9X4LWJ9_9ACTN|nr:hypothetical protein [Rhodococcus sp. D2-41]MDG3008848.1 hypothetical protein [Rhodococcus sp. D2-41]MDG3012941.1 hypothetical protein [Corynebacteriales bacterium D3-21]